MQFNCGEMKVGGFYTFLLNGEPVFESPSKNLITDFGWTRISNLTSAAPSGTIVQVGTSNTPPSLTDTALGGFLAQVGGATNAAIGTGTDAAGSYTFSRITFAFAQGAVVGNLAEVGFKVLNADASLTSRSLIKDGLGNPAVIVCTSIDQLTVLYELRYYRAPLDVTGSVTVAGVATTYIFRTSIQSSGIGADGNLQSIGGLSPTHVPSWSHYGTGSTFGAVGTEPSGASTSVNAPAIVGKVVTVNPTNTVLTLSTSVCDTAQGNSSGGVVNAQWGFGVSAAPLGAFGFLKANFVPAIAKNNTKTLQYSFSFTFTRL